MLTKIEREVADMITAYGNSVNQDDILKLESYTKNSKMKQKCLAEVDV